MYLFFSSFINTLFLYIGSCDRFYTYIVLIFLYMWMYVSFTYLYMCCFFHLPLHVLFLSPTSTYVVSFLPLYTCFLLIVCNLLFMFHTTLP